MFTAFKLWFHIFYWFFITRNRSGRWVFPDGESAVASRYSQKYLSGTDTVRSLPKAPGPAIK
jgi:ribose/xylose/arabinose/galactoside ABC-type transport system permease subunit